MADPVNSEEIAQWLDDYNKHLPEYHTLASTILKHLEDFMENEKSRKSAANLVSSPKTKDDLDVAEERVVSESEEARSTPWYTTDRYKKCLTAIAPAWNPKTGESYPPIDHTTKKEGYDKWLLTFSGRDDEDTRPSDILPRSQYLAEIRDWTSEVKKSNAWRKELNDGSMSLETYRTKIAQHDSARLEHQQRLRALEEKLTSI